MSGITRRGEEPPHANPAKRVAPPTADKSYDRHIADNGRLTQWLREAGMLDDGPAPDTKEPLRVQAYAANPHLGTAVSVPFSTLVKRQGAVRDYAHLYTTENGRPAVTGVHKGPSGGVYYTATAGDASWHGREAFKRGPKAMREVMGRGTGMWDWADPNKNGLNASIAKTAAALDPNQNGVAAALDPNKNGVAAAFDPAQNGVNDLGDKIKNELVNPDSDFRSQIAPGLLEDVAGPAGPLIMEGVNALQRAATNGTFTNGPQNFFDRVGHEFTSADSDLATKILPAAVHAATGVDADIVRDGIQAAASLAAPPEEEQEEPEAEGGGARGASYSDSDDDDSDGEGGMYGRGWSGHQEMRGCGGDESLRRVIARRFGRTRESARVYKRSRVFPLH